MSVSVISWFCFIISLCIVLLALPASRGFHLRWEKGSVAMSHDTIAQMMDEQREASTAVATYRRMKRRALVELTVEQLRRLIPQNPALAALTRQRSPISYPMPDVLSDSAVNCEISSVEAPKPQPQLSKDEIKERLRALYQRPGDDVECVVTPPPVPLVAPQSREQIIETLRRLYN